MLWWHTRRTRFGHGKCQWDKFVNCSHQPRCWDLWISKSIITHWFINNNLSCNFQSTVWQMYGFIILSGIHTIQWMSRSISVQWAMSCWLGHLVQREARSCCIFEGESLLVLDEKGSAKPGDNCNVIRPSLFGTTPDLVHLISWSRQGAWHRLKLSRAHSYTLTRHPHPMCSWDQYHSCWSPSMAGSHCNQILLQSK